MNGLDASLGRHTEPPKLTFISGLPFGRNGEEVLASVGGAGLYFRTPDAQILGNNLPGKEWSYRVDVSDIRALTMSPVEQAGSGWFGLFKRQSPAIGAQRYRLVISAAILPGKTQDIEVQGTPEALEGLIAELTDRRGFYRDKKNNEMRWAWRD
ncbi:MAG: hypothetical protein EXR52_06550 [Dehalococcoidia bacterium]|nr:hypothetical protein [Dehalococcoidia bacterium]